MLTIPALLLEALSIIVCLHCIFDEKVKFNISMMAMLLCHVIFLLEVSMEQLNRLYSMTIYVIYILYCIIRFKVSFIKATVSMVFCITVMTIMQFVVLLGISFLPFHNESARAALINGIVLLLCVFVVPKGHLARMKNWIFSKCTLTYLVMGLALIVAGTIICQNKVWEGIQIELYIFAVPAICICMVLAEKWLKNRGEVEELSSELQEQKRFQFSYDELLKEMRIRQHNFNNQLSAIIGTHYVYNTYEELIQAQGALYEDFRKDNKYSRLLWLGNNTIAGFLFMKFKEIEDRRINVELQIRADAFHPVIPDYLLIEMIGILLDNAAEEAEKQKTDRTIRFVLLQKDDLYLIKIANRNAYVPYEEIESWFKLGESKKGKGRGIGLYRVTQICLENDCIVRAQNTSYETENWIEFILEVKTGPS